MKLKTIIIEDEANASKNLKLMIEECDPNIEVVKILDSVKNAKAWLAENEHPDFGFFDIQLGDGTSFDIFSTIKINFPVIFATAYDEYAIQAFKVNSID